NKRPRNSRDTHAQQAIAQKVQPKQGLGVLDLKLAQGRAHDHGQGVVGDGVEHEIGEGRVPGDGDGKVGVLGEGDVGLVEDHEALELEAVGAVRVLDAAAT